MFQEAIASTYLLKYFCRYGYVICTYFLKKQIQLYNVYTSEMLESPNIFLLRLIFHRSIIYSIKKPV